MSALISEEKLTLMCQLQPGVCDHSCGIDVANIANFPEEVIENAKNRIAKLEGINLIYGHISDDNASSGFSNPIHPLFLP